MSFLSCLLLEEKYLYFANSNLFALHFYKQKYVIDTRCDNSAKKALKHGIKQEITNEQVAKKRY